MLDVQGASINPSLPWNKSTRGEISLDVPVTCQNLLDGVIKFTVTGERGTVETLVPQVSEISGNLIIVASLGTIEITNVHQGNTLYDKLDLVVNWSANKTSLRNINVAPGPRVEGVVGLLSWPKANIVSHNGIISDVKIIVDGNVESAYIEVKSESSVIGRYDKVGQVITVPYNVVEDAISQKLTLSLTIDGESSYIIFLPEIESEDFSFIGYYQNDGRSYESENYVNTGIISVSYVKDIVYRGRTQGGAKSLVAFDENDNFVKVLIDNGESGLDYHIQNDGSFKKVAASSLKNDTRYLKLYFEDEPES